ncbi:uncharacterized protein LOC125834816 [Solanum verrucosum]|uniref:uncharacterized protein LOC125834816 n=1 Tax=Solanum verrucosum TaxID=315347 RepID=UPI0020D17F78|nr:uncharacterized protein LOC125834816 [Solanum verrucosum]
MRIQLLRVISVRFVDTTCIPASFEFNSIKVSSNSCLCVSFHIIPPQRAIRERPSRRNVNSQGQEVSNVPKVQPPQGEVTNDEFANAIQMLTPVVKNQTGQQKVDRQDVADISKIREFLRIDPPEFLRSEVTEDLENFVEELQKEFEVMHVADAERVELASYKLKGVARIWHDQWKKRRAEGATPLSWESMSVQEYILKFTQLSIYALEMVANMRSRMSLFVSGLSRLSSKEDRAALREATLGTGGGANCLHAITSRQYQENSPNVVIAMRFDISPKQLLEPFSVSTPIGEFVVAERVYLDFTISVNHKDTIADLVELYMVDFDVILGKANVVVDALSRLSMGSTAHVEEGKKELAKEVHRLAHLGVHLLDSSESGVVVMNGVESSLVSEVKEKQDKDPLLLELKANVYNHKVMSFEQGDMAYLDIKRISKRVGNVAYELELPSKLAAIYPVFHISILKKCLGNPSLIVPTENIGIKDGLSYEEMPIQILDRQVRKLRTKEVASIKVL